MDSEEGTNQSLGYTVPSRRTTKYSNVTAVFSSGLLEPCWRVNLVGECTDILNALAQSCHKPQGGGFMAQDCGLLQTKSIISQRLAG